MSTYELTQRDFTTISDGNRAAGLSWRYRDLAECVAGQMAILAADRWNDVEYAHALPVHATDAVENG